MIECLAAEQVVENWSDLDERERDRERERFLKEIKIRIEVKDRIRDAKGESATDL